MKRLMYRRRFLTLILMIALTLAGCSKAESRGADADGQAQVSNEDEVYDSAPDKTPDNIQEDSKPEESDPHPELSYEAIIRGENGGWKDLGSPPNKTVGEFKYVGAHYNSEGNGSCVLYTESGSYEGELVLPSYCEIVKGIFVPVTGVNIDADLSNVTNVVFPKYVMTIYGWDKLMESQWYQNLPEGPVYSNEAYLTYKGDMPDNYDLVVKDGTKVIVNSALSNERSLRTVTLPDSVLYIGNYAFFRCTGLCQINMSRNLLSVGTAFVDQCQTLKDIFMPATLICSEPGAFNGNMVSVSVWYEGEEDDMSHEWKRENENITVSSGCTYEQYSAQTVQPPDDIMGLSNLTNIPICGTVQFGSYEQDNDTSNGPEPIEWYVLQKDGSLAMLISKVVLDTAPYYSGRDFFHEGTPVENERGFETVVNKANITYLVVTWDKSNLREWLNNDFYNTAFTDEEKTQIDKHLNATPAIHGANNPCPDTEDYVTIPTLAELTVNGTAWAPIIEPGILTPYAYTKIEYGAYWLRSNNAKGEDDNNPEIQIFSERKSKDVSEFSGSDVDDDIGVRPVIWVKIP